MDQSPVYNNQYNRMIRWYEKFKEISQGFHDLEALYKIDEFYDIIYSFFQNCYHLKDWIKNDNSIIIPNNLIEDYINNNKCLSICADICNGSKHLILKKSRSALKHEPGKWTATLRAGTGIRIMFHVETTDKKLDVFSLATDCVRKWKHFKEIYIEKKEVTPVV